MAYSQRRCDVIHLDPPPNRNPALLLSLDALMLPDPPRTSEPPAGEGVHTARKIPPNEREVSHPKERGLVRSVRPRRGLSAEAFAQPATDAFKRRL